jgi:hypothetical protein
LEKQIAHSQSKDVKADTADSLLGMQVNSDECHCQSHDRANKHGSKYPKPEIPGSAHNIKSGKGAEASVLRRQDLALHYAGQKSRRWTHINTELPIVFQMREFRLKQ